MIVRTSSSIFGSSGVEVVPTSDVVVKSRRIGRYRYSRKVGKKYVMTNRLSLQYLATIFYFQHKAPVAFLLFYGDHILLATLKENRRFEFHPLPVVESVEMALKKVREVYIVSKNFVIYTNADPEEIGQHLPAVQYIRIHDGLLKKYTIDVQRIKVLILTVIACVLFVATVYRLLYPKREEVKQMVTKPPPPPYRQVYTDYMRNRINESIRTVENFINRRTVLKPAEFFRLFTSEAAGISGTVVSLAYRPGYNKDGEVYTRTLDGVMPEPVYHVPEVDEIIRTPERCSDLSPAEYTVVEYDTVEMPKPLDVERTYPVRVAKLEYSTGSIRDLYMVIYKSLRTCTIIEKIEEKSNSERRYTVYAAKYRPKENN